MAVYSTGTVTVTNGDATVTGSGTAWSTGSAVEAGDIFVRSGDSVSYVVASVATDTSLELTANYGGASGSGAYYGIYRDFTTNAKLPSLFGGDKSDWGVAVQDTLNKIDNWALGWNETPFTCTYASGTTFTCSGDKTTLFVVGTRLKIVHAGGTTYHTVISSAYGANTTVTVNGSISTPISRVYHCLFIAGASGAQSQYPSFSVHKNDVDQTGVVHDTPTLVTWSTELFDTHSNFATNTFTPTVAGKYLLSANIRFSVSVDQTLYGVSIYKNAGDLHWGNMVSSSGIGSMGVSVTAVCDANGTTDYFTIYAYQSSGVNQTISGENLFTYWTGCRIG